MTFPSLFDRLKISEIHSPATPVIHPAGPPLVTPDYADQRKDALIKAMRAVSLTDTPRGPFHFDRFGNFVGDVYIRCCEKKDGKRVNTTIKTYGAVSQFRACDEPWFLSQPVYSRDYPTLKI
jgi:hypothetical protein